MRASDSVIAESSGVIANVIPSHIIGWMHAGNEGTSSIVTNFKKSAGNVRVNEFYSVAELDEVCHSTKINEYQTIVTEMGFWDDKARTQFNVMAGLLAMRLINQFAPHVRNKFVISARVGCNENNLLDESRGLGFTHSSAFEAMYPDRPLVLIREKELHACLELLRNSLFCRPVASPDNAADNYPIKHFNIENVLDIENDQNRSRFVRKRTELSENHKSDQWEWLFHGSRSEEATFNIARNNFSLAFLGSFSGNRGCYGAGIYFSTRGYLPMFIAILQNHLMILACKVM